MAQALVQAPPDDPVLASALADLRQLGLAAQQATAQWAQSQSAPAPAPAPAPGPAPQDLNLSGALQSMRTFTAVDAASAERARQQAEAARREAQASAALAAAHAAQRAQGQAQQASRQSEMAQSQATVFGMSLQLQQARERIKVLMAQSDRRNFDDAQSARRHFMQLRTQLLREGQQPTKWLCNWADCKHDTPNDCGNPTLGGRWLFE